MTHESPNHLHTLFSHPALLFTVFHLSRGGCVNFIGADEEGFLHVPHLSFNGN